MRGNATRFDWYSIQTGSCRLPVSAAKALPDKRFLYLEAGAREVWLCGEDGKIRFFASAGEIPASELCPEFPKEVG